MLAVVAGAAVLSLAAYLWRTRNSRWSDLTNLVPRRSVGRVGETTFKILPPLALLLLGLLLVGSGLAQIL